MPGDTHRLCTRGAVPVVDQHPELLWTQALLMKWRRANLSEVPEKVKSSRKAHHLGIFIVVHLLSVKRELIHHLLRIRHRISGGVQPKVEEDFTPLREGFMPGK